MRFRWRRRREKYKASRGTLSGWPDVSCFCWHTLCAPTALLATVRYFRTSYLIRHLSTTLLVLDSANFHSSRLCVYYFFVVFFFLPFIYWLIRAQVGLQPMRSIESEFIFIASLFPHGCMFSSSRLSIDASHQSRFLLSIMQRYFAPLGIYISFDSIYS